MARILPPLFAFELARLAAAHHLGGWVNAVDHLTKAAGSDTMFVEVIRATSAVSHILTGLQLDTGAHPLAADAWAEVCGR